jgi:four helix bundle protein
MGTIQRFQDIQAWQSAREMTRVIYSLSATGAFAWDFPLRDQIRRAAISAMSNIAEGFERGGNREFINFLSIAKGSAGEVESQLYVALDQTYITQDVFETTQQSVRSVSRLLGGFIVYLQNSEMRGPKFNPSEPDKRAN